MKNQHKIPQILDEEPSDEDSPERRLIAAVIQRTLLDLRPYDISEKKDSFKARSWFASQSQEPFSFLWCCDELRIEPQEVLQIADAILAGQDISHSLKYRHRASTRKLASD